MSRHRPFAGRWRLFVFGAFLAILALAADAPARRVLGEKGGSSSPSGGQPRAQGSSTPLAPLGTGDAFSGFGAFSADSTAGDSVSYSADEISYDVEGETILLIGHARVESGTMELTAHRIRFLVGDDLVIAEGEAMVDQPDSILGMPTFANGAEKFTGERMVYNIRTQRGLVEGGTSAIPDGIYEGRLVKRTGDEQLDVYEGVYTTCTHNPPHYVFEGTRMRILVGDKVIAKPVVLKVADVPMFWLPFGVFFTDQDRRSGFLSPRLGDNPGSAGRYMRGLGYYYAPNDYLGAQLAFDIDEKRGYEWRFTSNYALRYRLSGGLGVAYSRFWDRYNSALGENVPGVRTWRVNAQHRQELSPRSSLRATIDYTTSDRPTLTPGSTQESVSDQTYQSQVSYSRRWESGSSVSVIARRTHSTITRQTDEILPQISISGDRSLFPEPEPQGRRALAAAASRRSDEIPWYRRIRYSWNWSGTNTGLHREETGASSLYGTWIYEEPTAVADSFITHQLTISPTYSQVSDGTWEFRSEGVGIVVSGTFYVVPGENEASPRNVTLYTTEGTQGSAALVGNAVAWGMAPYPPATFGRPRGRPRYTQSTGQGLAITVPLPAPRWMSIQPSLAWSADWRSDPDPLPAQPPSYLSSYANAHHRLNAGIGTSATFYGLFPAAIGPLVALRHVVTPSVGASFVVERFLRDGTYLVGGRNLGGDTSRVFTFGLRNILQAKARWRDRDVRFDRLLAVDTGVQYNPDADESTGRRRWSDITTAITLQPADLITSRITAVHTLYNRGSGGVGELDWRRPDLVSLGAVTTLNLAGGGRSAAERTGDRRSLAEQLRQRDARGLEIEPELREQEQTPQEWSPGWQLSMSHSYQWIRQGSVSFASPPQQSVSVDANFTPWRDWQVDLRTTYDITRKIRSGESIAVTRKLHCWQAELNMVPTGLFRGYYFRIYVIGLPEVKIESASENLRPGS